MSIRSFVSAIATIFCFTHLGLLGTACAQPRSAAATTPVATDARTIETVDLVGKMRFAKLYLMFVDMSLSHDRIDAACLYLGMYYVHAYNFKDRLAASSDPQLQQLASPLHRPLVDTMGFCDSSKRSAVGYHNRTELAAAIKLVTDQFDLLCTKISCQ